jgi:starch synthase
MKIVFVAAEVAPYSKTGGLADVAGSLPKEFLKMGYEVLVITPRYRLIRQNLEYVNDYSIPMFNKNMTAIIKKHVQKVDKKELNTYFVDSAYYFDRDGMYCHPDEAERFAFFDKACCKIIDEFQPDIVHLNDWQTGPIAVLLRDVFKNYSCRIMYTIHNMEYNGRFPADVINNFGLDPNIYMKPDKLEFFGDFSFSKCGILYSDMCTTVSATYANEIQTEEYGFGYEGLLRMKKEQNKLVGIPNGIDYERYDPSKGKNLFKNYDADHIEDKKINKKKLQEELGLAIKDVPVIAIVSRVVQHKGYDILIESLKEILKNDVQFVQLGIGDDHYIKRMCLLKKKYPDKVSINHVFDDILAERIYAGADIFMMPSLFEPCGLAQLICFRYGTIPIARKTGGLNDTVIGYLGNKELGNGFTFFNSRKEDLIEVTHLALAVYDNKEEWHKLQKRVMLMDCSWKKSAEFYNIVYKRML